MSYANNIGDVTDILPILAASDITANNTGTTPIDLSQYDGQVFIVADVGAGTGSGRTLDLVLQHSDASGSGFANVTGGAFTQVGTSASLQKKVFDVSGFKRYVRLVATIAGSSPSYPISVNAYATKKYL
jgi:hypothetical protein